MQAGFPPGVLNVVPGLGNVAGHAVAHHQDIDKVCYRITGTVQQLLPKTSNHEMREHY